MSPIVKREDRGGRQRKRFSMQWPPHLTCRRQRCSTGRTSPPFGRWLIFSGRVFNLPLKEVASRAGVSPSRVSKVQHQGEQQQEVGRPLRLLLVKLRPKLRTIAARSRIGKQGGAWCLPRQPLEDRPPDPLEPTIQSTSTPITQTQEVSPWRW